MAEEVGKILREALTKQRGYAGFWDWPDKTTKEWQIASTFVEVLNKDLEDKIVSGRQHPAGENCAPDAEVTTKRGEKWAVELTEIVNRKAIEATKRGKSVVARWSDQHIVAAVKERLSAKDRRELIKGGPFDRVILLLHTDEDMLTVQCLSNALAGVNFDTRIIDEIYILISYDPRQGGYPLLKLGAQKQLAG